MSAKNIFSFLFLIVLASFFGCQKNDMSSIDSPVNSDQVDGLAKHGDGDGLFGNYFAVYTLSNAAAGNEVMVYSRSHNGRLNFSGSYSTGGTGTGAGLGSQGAIVNRGRFIFAVNAGSNDVSVLEITKHGLTVVDKKSSGGTTPISLTVHGRLLYVLNSGGSGNISGFRIHYNGTLSEISGSTKPLSTGASGPAQIEFNPWGNVLVVTEKATNVISSYSVGYNGVANGPTVTASAGNTPFGFEFDRRGRLIVSDAFGGGAGAGAMSSYNVSTSGVDLITGPVANTQTAPCWVVVTKNGRFAYTSNTGTANISGYKIKHNGSIVLLNDGGNTGSTGDGSKPIDMAISNNSQYLYCLNAGNQTISVFRINNGHGNLYPIQTVSGLTAGGAGLAAN